MDQRTAIRELTKLLGRQMGVKLDNDALKAEGRAEAEAAANVWQATAEAAKARADARKAVLLKDLEYVAARTEQREAEIQQHKHNSLASQYRITVGVSVAGLLFDIQAQGDNWQEVVDAVRARKVNQTA